MMELNFGETILARVQGNYLVLCLLASTLLLQSGTEPYFTKI